MKDIHDQTFYELLEVDPSATQEEILKAYNRARATYGHNSPALYSLFNKEEAQELLKLIDEAYAVLSNQFKRRQYDSQTHGVQPAALPQQDSQKAPSHPSFHEDDSHFAIPSAGAIPGFSETIAAGPGDMSPASPSSLSIGTPKNSEMAGGAVKASAGTEVQQKSNQTRDAGQSTSSDRFQLQNHGSPSVKGPNTHSSQEPPAPGKTPVGATSFGGYKVDPAFEDEIKKTEIFSGSVIQKIRLYKNITIDQISESTKISRPYLLAIESGNFTSLPAPVFVRGFIVQIAKILGLDPVKTANSFVTLLKESQKK